MKRKPNFFKKNERPDFHSMLLKQCEYTSKSISLLLNFMNQPDDQPADSIEQCEKKADKVRRSLIDYVENSFITPLDRHDLFAVSRSIDDMTDKVKDLKDFLVFFSYTPFEKHVEMARCIASSILAITSAMESWNDNCDVFWENLVKAKKNENQVKRLYWEIIAELDKQTLPLKEIIIMREFSKDLNCLANKIGRAADSISDLKIKSIK
jgi:hypothetical protein